MTKQAAVIIFILGLICVAGSQLLMKARFASIEVASRDGRPLFSILFQIVTDVFVIFAGLLVVAGALCWYTALFKLPVSLMLPVAGVIAPIVSIGAHFLLGENLTPAKTSAILIIMTGVMWLGWLNS